MGAIDSTPSTIKSKYSMAKHNRVLAPAHAKSSRKLALAYTSITKCSHARLAL